MTAPSAEKFCSLNRVIGAPKVDHAQNMCNYESYWYFVVDPPLHREANKGLKMFYA